MCLLEQLERYEPYNEQEARDRALLLRALREEADVFTRENDRMHMTASAWVTNEAHDRVLMAYHNIYDSWAWLGGHADGEEDLLAVALREVREESGVKHARPASENIFSLEVLTVDGHEKRGAYVSSHLHLNVTYLLIADDGSHRRERSKPAASRGSASAFIKSSTPSSPRCGEGKKGQKKAARSERLLLLSFRSRG